MLSGYSRILNGVQSSADWVTQSYSVLYSSLIEKSIKCYLFELSHVCHKVSQFGKSEELHLMILQTELYSSMVNAIHWKENLYQRLCCWRIQGDWSEIVRLSTLIARRQTIADNAIIRFLNEKSSATFRKHLQGKHLRGNIYWRSCMSTLSSPESQRSVNFTEWIETRSAGGQIEQLNVKLKMKLLLAERFKFSKRIEIMTWNFPSENGKWKNWGNLQNFWKSHSKFRARFLNHFTYRSSLDFASSTFSGFEKLASCPNF